jgi:hypothetical protein
MRGTRVRKLGAAVGVVALALAATAAPASAHGGSSHDVPSKEWRSHDGPWKHWPGHDHPSHGGGEPVVSAPIAEGLAGPLQFEVSDRGSILVGQSFAGTITKIDSNGTRTDLLTGAAVDGVSAGAFGSVIYTNSNPEEGFAELKVRLPSGATKTITDLHYAEETRNPDQHQSYGLQGLTPECAAQIPADAGLLPYQGVVDSHPYAVTPVWGGWLVADAGANAILHVSWWGKVRTVAVLPPQAPVTVTAEAAAANELPSCVAGKQWVTEPVPTDVEVGRDGLYVSTLPGGPEDPSFGARGSVYKVNPWSGSVKQIATGFAGAVNLAISPWGQIYVSELFGNQVSKIVNGHPDPVVSLPMPSGLEWSRGKLYVATNSLDAGAIQTISF